MSLAAGRLAGSGSILTAVLTAGQAVLSVTTSLNHQVLDQRQKAVSMLLLLLLLFLLLQEIDGFWCGFAM